MVTKAVSEFFDKGGIADQAIRFNGFPSLEKDDVTFNAPGASTLRSILRIGSYPNSKSFAVSFIMKTEMVVLQAASMTVADLGARLG